MAFDIKLNNLSEKAEAGYEFEVKLPDGTSTDFFITVRGNQSPKMKKYSKDLFNKMQMEELRNKRKGKGEQPIDLDEAEATLKYVKTKFARAMLGILKVTQNNAKPTWKYVPLQDFTSSSDIDWSKSVHEIDLQLYRKYGLDEKEIEFIETHVKEMA